MGKGEGVKKRKNRSIIENRITVRNEKHCFSFVSGDYDSDNLGSFFICKIKIIVQAPKDFVKIILEIIL